MFITILLGASITTVLQTIFILFVLGGLSDILDGYIARKKKMVTEFGKLIDPIADKALINVATVIVLITSLLASQTNTMIVVFVALVISIIRDSAVGTMRVVIATKGKIVAANKWGKLKTITQFAAITLALAGVTFPVLKIRPNWVSIMFAISAVLTLYSGILYLAQAKKFLKK